MQMVFLMCSERSGSNFIAKLLNGHERICGPSTKHIINPVARNIFRYEDLKNESNWNALLSDIVNLTSVSFSIWKTSFDVNTLRGLVRVGDIAGLIASIFSAEAAAHGKDFVFIKENHVYEFLPFLLINYPEAKYIYQTRDPRDMALSWKLNKDHPGGVVAAARQWKIDQQNNLKNFNELKKNGFAHFVRYEDLISNVESEVAKICKFLGVDYDPNVINFYSDEFTQKNAMMNDAWSNLSKSVLSDNKDKYRAGLSDFEIMVIEKICYFEMKALKYGVEYDWNDLMEISDVDIAELEEIERVTYAPTRAPGVAANMVAKKRFYEHISS